MGERWVSNLAFPFYGNVPPLPLQVCRFQYRNIPYLWFAMLDFDDQQQSAFTDFRYYFGEKIALYVAFLSHLTAWMRVSSFLGFCFTWNIVAHGSFDHPELPFFALAMFVWATMMLEYWKRTEVR